MDDDHDDLLGLLDLEPIEVNLFRGRSPEVTWGRIFGGQVIAQALVAAYNTVEDRLCHSLHAYFIRPGDPSIPVLYQVERARDGKSFTTRRVAAIQHGEQIFNFAASFQVPEEGFEHQQPMPKSAWPDELKSDLQTHFSTAPESVRKMIARRPVEHRPVLDFEPASGPDKSSVATWIRASVDVGDDVKLNQAVLAYASDYGMLASSMRPHDITFRNPGMQVASLDHAMWFHRPSRADQWHLYTHESPSASGARGFNRGAIHDIQGRLVASVAQEGLIRYRPDAKA